MRVDMAHAYVGRTNISAFTEDKFDLAYDKLRTDVSAGELPALTLPYLSRLEEDIKSVSPKIHKFKHMILLGIGGSALGARALQKAFFPNQDRPGHQGPWLWIADNIDSDTLESWMNSINPEDAVAVVISKSGGTIETLSQYFLIRHWLETSIGDQWTEHMVFVTDKEKGFLRTEATKLNISSLEVPDFLGGRYSVFSAVGVVPAEFLGIDWRTMINGVKSACANLASPNLSKDSLKNTDAFKIAKWAYLTSQADYNQLIFFNYIPQLSYLGAWFSQLWAESLGKEGKGTMPLPAVGVTDQHSLQQMFLDGPRDKACIMLSCPNLSQGEAAGPIFPDDIPDKWSYLKGRRFGELLGAECLGTSAAIAGRDIPLLKIELENPGFEETGKLMGTLMGATLLTGWLLGINPVDQPAVELGKRLACARLGAKGYDNELAVLEKFLNK